MPIQAKCSNPACGKVLNVKEEHAGKQGKCPGCGGVVHVPAAPAPRVAAVPQAGKQATMRQETQDSKPPKRLPSTRLSTLLFGGGIALILLAGLAPLCTWVSIAVAEGEAREKKVGQIAIGGMGVVAVKTSQAADAKTQELAPGIRPEGRLILSLCIAAAVVLAIGFALAMSRVLQQKQAERILNVTLLAGLGWGIVLLVWSIGWFWKTVTLSHALQKALEEGGVGARAARFTFEPFPGLGLFLLLVPALLSPYLFSQVANLLNALRKRMFVAEQMKGMNRLFVDRLFMDRKRLLVAECAGILVGGLFLALVVRPWNADELWQAVKPMALDLVHSALGPARPVEP